MTPGLAPLAPITDNLIAAAEISAALARKAYRAATRRSIGAAIAAGSETPLWNELARACERTLTRYGAKANLGRELGLSRQRIHVLLVAKTAVPDGERALQLLAWLGRQHHARQKVSSIR